MSFCLGQVMNELSSNLEAICDYYDMIAKLAPTQTRLIHETVHLLDGSNCYGSLDS